jgi:hypothetical protein
MPRQIPSLVVCALTVALAASPALATTLSGTVTYDDLPIATTFPEMSHVSAAAYDTATNEWSFFGTVDPAAGTYEIAGLTEGLWYVRVLFGTQDFGTRVLVESGEIVGEDYITIGTDPEATLDLEGRFAYRITQPFDGLWPGSLAVCPYGPELPMEFTFAWEPVPRAVRYEAAVGRWACGASLESAIIDTEETSVQIFQGAVAGEEYLLLSVRAYSAGGRQIAARPNLDYEDGSADGAFVHQEGGDEGRTVHPSSSVFVSQVANLPGVAPSFWTSDVVLTNPLSSSVTATLTFTPRNANGLTNYLSETVTIPAGSCRVLTDVVGTIFDTTGAGSLEVSPATLGVASRISTPGESGGTYGQGFPAGSSATAASFAGPVKKLGTGGLVRGAFRSNLVLTEIWGESATVQVTVLDRDGAVLGITSVSLPPFGTTQINDLVGQVGGPSTLTEGQVTVAVTSGMGQVISALSLVDQVSQDPTTLVLEPR